MYAELPNPIVISAGETFLACALMIPAMIVGFVLAFFPVLILGSLLSALGSVFAPARSLLAWIAAGARTTAAAIQGLGMGAIASPTGFALITTGTICAGLAWSSHDRRRREAGAAMSIRNDATGFPMTTARG